MSPYRAPFGSQGAGIFTLEPYYINCWNTIPCWSPTRWGSVITTTPQCRVSCGAAPPFASVRRTISHVYGQLIKVVAEIETESNKILTVRWNINFVYSRVRDYRVNRTYRHTIYSACQLTTFSVTLFEQNKTCSKAFNRCAWLYRAMSMTACMHASAHLTHCSQFQGRHLYLFYSVWFRNCPLICTSKYAIII